MDNIQSSTPKTREEIKDLLLNSSRYLTYGDNITANEKEQTYFKSKHYKDEVTKKDTAIVYTKDGIGNFSWIMIRQEDYYGPGKHIIFAGTFWIF